ncbi:hypothetical protein OOT46_24480 [Aquabacterium sp. A7-Y]|uniref:hypothetical protein n=1 Tax=Aquabacterium sp. A7-Y TaxID=1349605 RepID=UPI00223D8092|nr:hypothetical protein [Aquabacterium sp. A7-Y]MCW7540983.1 hypothetical protein [Aquabacterium sp. A7-Y]
MGPKPPTARSDQELFRLELVNLIDQRHELVKLAKLIDWDDFERRWSPQFVAHTGRPAPPTRLMAALLYLRHVHGRALDQFGQGRFKAPDEEKLRHFAEVALIRKRRILLPSPQQGPFTKEAGKVVIDAQGRRVSAQ